MTFLNVVEIESGLTGLAGAYPRVSQLITLPFLTAEGRQSHALRIGTGPCSRKAVLIISGVHAREWGGPDICVDFAADLLEAWSLATGLTYGGTSFTAEEIRSIVQRLDVIVFPDVNPDGRHHSQTAMPMWRKNRNPASSGGRTDRVGVDVNRNFDILWDFPTGFAPGAQSDTLASASPGSDQFHGTAPFSEAESKNVRWLFDQFPRISWFMDIHSHGGDIVHPWGDDSNQGDSPAMNFTNPAWNGQRGLPGDTYAEYISACDLANLSVAGKAVSAAIAGVRGETYPVAQSFFLPGSWVTYPTSGSSEDWAFSRYFADSSKEKVRSYTLEFNRVNTFFPTWPQMQAIILDIDAGLVRFCLGAVPQASIANWWCRWRVWMRWAIWPRVFPPDIWGPYGPWRRFWGVVGERLYTIVAPILRRFGRGERGGPAR